MYFINVFCLLSYRSSLWSLWAWHPLFAFLTIVPRGSLRSRVSTVPCITWLALRPRTTAATFRSHIARYSWRSYLTGYTLYMIRNKMSGYTVTGFAVFQWLSVESNEKRNNNWRNKVGEVKRPSAKTRFHLMYIFRLNPNRLDWAAYSTSCQEQN